tara:strand:- start:869 stop:1780 length:912 start_codon:yes stop_codon:yes gene_type:complete
MLAANLVAVSSPAPFRTARVIANPISGQGTAKLKAEALAKALRDRGIDAELAFTEARGDGERLARENTADVVCVVGGDGSLREALEGLDPATPVAVLATGTANVLAMDLGMPRTPLGVADMVVNGRIQGLDVGRVNGQLTFLVVGVGFDGAAVADVERRRKGPITKSTYVRAVLSTLVHWKAPKLVVEADGERVPGSYGWVLISNVVKYGGFLRLAPDRKLDDGRFELFLFPGGTRRALMGYGLRALLMRRPGPKIQQLSVRQVRITSETAVPFEIDGDLGGETPVDFEILPDPRHLIVPSDV